MPTRRNIDSYAYLDRVINRIDQQAAGIPPGDLPFSNAAWANYQAKRLIWKKEYGEMRAAKVLQTQSTALTQPANKAITKLVSHFIQVLNLAIDRGVYPASVRAYYGLPVDSDRLPNLKSEAEKLTAAQNIVTGEAERVGSGGSPMTNPSASEVEAAMNDFMTLQQTQSQLKQKFSTEEKEVNEVFEEVAESVNDLFAELEFANRKETPGFVRNVLREWGLEYTNDTGEVFEQTFTVGGNASLVVGEVSLTAQSAITATLLTDAGNQQVVICRKLGGCDTSGKELLFNVPVPTTTADLPGEDDNLVITNNTNVPVEVRVRIEG